MKTVLPASFAPTGTIRWLPTCPKCTGRRLWQTGQTLMLVSPAHCGHSAAPRPPWRGEGRRQCPGEPGPVTQRRVGRRGAALAVALSRPVQRNQGCRREISS